MFHIQLTNFRCFASPPAVEIRPITLLVGENSAGKTSFLAAARVLMEGFSHSSLNRFNNAPYYLGSFNEIAHYRGGAPGRARRFSLALSATIDSPATKSRIRVVTPIRHRFTFAKGSPQPLLVEYDFVAGDLSANLSVTDSVSLKLLDSNKEILRFSADDRRLPPASLLRSDLSYIAYLFTDLSYNVSTREQQDASDPIGAAPQPTRQKLVRLAEQFRESAQFLSKDVFASAPVRTQPLRTYTPSEITPSAEGAHVPLEMARQKKNTPAAWTAIHDALAKFGKSSGLFDDIDIRTVGRGDNNPFQIMVKTGGPRMNLVDVGYGISQVLPIIYQLQQHQYDAFLLQQPEVHLHPKAQAALGTLIADLSNDKPETIHIVETHSDYVIDRIRVEVAEKHLDPNKVTIVFFDRREHSVKPTNIYLSDKGEIQNPPDNFRAFFLQEQRRLLGL